MKADNFDIKVGNSTRLRGEFDGRGLGDNDEPMVLSFDFEELLTDMNTIARVVPGFRPPKQFLKLNRISFKGSYQLFDGFDHVLYGDFVTSLGPGRVDMQLNLKDGPEKAIYRGDLKSAVLIWQPGQAIENLVPAPFRSTLRIILPA